MDAKNIALLIGAFVVLFILFYSGSKLVGSYDKETVANTCETTEFQTSQGIQTGKLVEGYNCPDGFHQEFGKFEDVKIGKLCCVAD